MERMRPPAVPEAPVPVLTEDQCKRLLLATCSGKSFDDRRDVAILRLMIDTGMCRVLEIAGLKVTDLDFEHEVAYVTGKGSRLRAWAPFWGEN